MKNDAELVFEYVKWGSFSLFHLVLINAALLIDFMLSTVP